MKNTDKSIQLFNLSLFGGRKSGLLKMLGRKINSQANTKMTKIFTLNPEQVVLTRSSDMFRSVVSRSSVNVIDGVGLAWATRVIQGKQVETIPGIDLAADLVKHCLEKQLPVMFIGGMPGVGEKAKDRIMNHEFRIKNNEYRIRNNESGIKNNEIDRKSLKIVEKNRQDKDLYEIRNTKYENLICVTHGYKNIHKQTKSETRAIFELIKKHKPRLVLVGFGAPHQEIWLDKHGEKLTQLRVKIGMVVGGSFDVWAGRVSRAPKIVRKLGFEWLWRLIQQPWRWRRQLSIVKFVGMVGGEIRGTI